MLAPCTCDSSRYWAAENLRRARAKSTLMSMGVVLHPGPIPNSYSLPLNIQSHHFEEVKLLISGLGVDTGCTNLLTCCLT